jgi:hypothetical protein
MVSTDLSFNGAGRQEEESVSHFMAGSELFLISLLILFLELACIRWFPAHVLFLTFFTNTVLLACFLGMSVGCLAASHRRNYLAWTPPLLAVALFVAHLIERTGKTFERMLDVGHQASPQLVFFGTEYHSQDLSRFAVPIELLCGFFFLVIALSLVGPGQELGRALNRLPNRVHAYTLNILGSIVGIILFAACSWFELSPFWWFLLITLGLGYFYFISPRHRLRWKMTTASSLVGSAPVTALLLLSILALAAYAPGYVVGAGQAATEQFWSPYYRIDFEPQNRSLSVNLVYHQQMVSRDEPYPAYALPHILNRDAGRQPFQDVLIIGAGSGNDVSRALQWGATHVDAVEIDPAIYRLGLAHHPDHPYSDARVAVHLDDGRNFLRSTQRKYDLIIYALVDSLVLHSGYSNIRLESYLFTQQTFADVRAHLKPGGQFVVYNYFRQGWIVARLQKGLEEIFGAGHSLVLTLPYRQLIEPEKSTFGDFTIFFAGDVEALRQAFGSQPEYWLSSAQSPRPDSPNGFAARPAPQGERATTGQDAKQASTEQPASNGPADQRMRFGLARVIPPEGPLRAATDDWPFLYLREPMIPTLSLRGAALMGTLTLLLIFLFQPRRPARASRRGAGGQMFFLGAGFMLIETKAVVLMALLFGSTWIVNSIVFFAVLLMILAANLWTIKLKPERLWPYYTGLFVALALNAIIPLDFFLGMNRALQIVGSCLLVFAPVFFAGVVFAVSFKRVTEPDRAFGANIAGAIMGGLAEYSSMLLGFQYVVLLALIFYALSALFFRRSGTSDVASRNAVEALPDKV